MIAAVLAVVLTLGDVEKAAVARAPALNEARARVGEAQALLDAARGGGLPHIIANYAQVPQGGSASGTILQRLTTVSGQVIVGDIAARDPLVAQGSAALRGALANEGGAERTERVKALGLFLGAIRLREVRARRAEILAGTQADRRAAVLRLQSGDVPRIDVVRSDVAMARAQGDLAIARADETNARRNLATEIGAEAEALNLPTLAQVDVAIALPSSLPAALQSALAGRPEIRAARADVAAEEAARRAMHGMALPALTVQAGYTTGTDSGIQVSGPSANVTLDISLSRAAADRARAEDARLAQAQARLSGAMQNVATEVANAFEMLKAQREAEIASATARAEAELEVHAATTGYREGASSSLNLADARRTYASAVIDEVNARAALDESILTFVFAVGGQP